MRFLFKNTLFSNPTSVGSFTTPFTSKKNIPISKKDFSIRPLKFSELDKLNKWAIKEGWNPGKYEYLLADKAFPNAHKGLFSIKNKLIASLSVIRYGNLVFFGNYIVSPNYREKNIGGTLVRTVLATLEDKSVLGLNGVKQQVGNYQRKYDFTPYYNTIRFSGIIKTPQEFNNSFSKSQKNIKIIGREGLNINQLIDYDLSVFLYPREIFIREWIKMPESHLGVAIKNGKICGYAVVSKCHNGYKIAPLFAEDEEIAKTLYKSIASKFDGKLMQVDISETNKSAIDLATQFNLDKKMFETTIMFKNQTKSADQLKEEIKEVYSYTSLERG